MTSSPRRLGAIRLSSASSGSSARSTPKGTSLGLARHGVLDARRSFLQKPFSPQAFLARVREVLNNASSRQAV